MPSPARPLPAASATSSCSSQDAAAEAARGQPRLGPSGPAKGNRPACRGRAGCWDGRHRRPVVQPAAVRGRRGLRRLRPAPARRLHQPVADLGAAGPGPVRAEARGWPERILREVDRALVIVLSGTPPARGPPTASCSAALGPRSLSVPRPPRSSTRWACSTTTAAPPSTTGWPQARRPRRRASARDVEAGSRTLHDGGPRSRPATGPRGTTSTAPARPAGMVGPLRPPARSHPRRRPRRLADAARPANADTLIALRSLFGHCKKNGTIFRNPTSRINVGQHEYGVIQPLRPDEIGQAVPPPPTPAARSSLALAAVHAARPARSACASTTSTSATGG